MNRQIKFRAWDKHKKVFMPTDVWAVVQTDFNAFGIMLKDWDNYKEGEYFYKYSHELQQFTGLSDKNGNEIYEGDVMCWEKYQNTGHHSVWVVEMNPLRPTKTWSATNEDAIVIGNIYEHPHLLNS